MHGIYPYDTSAENASCWVYILQAEGCHRMVKFSLDIRRELASLPPGSRIVFRRGFADIVDAVAFKVFLQSLSPASLERIIRNPGMNDFRGDFMDLKNRTDKNKTEDTLINTKTKQL